MDRDRAFRAFFLAAFALLLWQLLRVFFPFLPAFLWAAAFSLVFYPVYPALCRRLPPDLAALAATVLVLVGVLLPLGLTGWVLARESAAVYPAAREWVLGLGGQDPSRGVPAPLEALWERADRLLLPAGLSVQELLLANLRSVNAAIGAAAADIAKQAVLLAFNLAVTVVCLFLFFRHGEPLTAWLLDLIPLPRSHKRAITRAAKEAFALVVRGVLANAVVQGGLAGLGFWAAGLRFPVFLAVACAFASLIPALGTALVWLPAGLLLLLDGSEVGGWLLTYCFLFVTVLDLPLKRRLAGEGARTRLPALLLFFSIVGGLRVYGVHGLVLGPLLFASALAFLRIYQAEYGGQGLA